MRVLVTGSGGFVGGSFGRVAAAKGHEVLGLARQSQSEADWPGRHVQVDVAHGDLTELLNQFKPDLVLHGAGSASVGASLRTPVDDLRAAVITWANLLDAVRRSSARPVIIFPSSAAVYGNPVALPVSEEAATSPISPYGFHKAACELLAQEYALCFGLKVIICRIFSTFGPRQRRLLIWELFAQLAGTEPTVWLEGTGAETRDFLDIEDLSQAMLALADPGLALEFDRAPLAFNMGRGVEISVMQLAEELSQAMDVRKQIRCRGNQRAGDPVRWQANVDRLRQTLTSWQPKPLSQSLATCATYWRSLKSS